MNTTKVAAALNTISLAFGELAEALSDGTAPVPAAPSALPALSDADFPPFIPTDESPYEPLAVAGPIESPMLSHCPTHDTPWTVKPGGVSKAGKAYNAFWKCDGKNPDGTWCTKKPVRAWADAHPLVAA